MIAHDLENRDVLLNDSQSTLRQVKGVLSDLVLSDERDLSLSTMVSEIESRPAGLAELVKAVVSTYSEIMGVIDNLRKSRGLLEEAAMQRLKSTHEKLAEVSSATEVAATGMLDGLDRALVLVDDLEAASATSDSEESAGHRDELREELHTLMNLLQFQDITSQQLGYASTVLQDIEDRMVRLADLFDLGGMEFKGAPDAGERARELEEEDHVTNDPDASTLNVEGRQALVDEIFS